MKTYCFWLCLLLEAVIAPIANSAIVNFEELSTFTASNPSGTGQYYNGNPGTAITNSVGWSSGGVFFNNDYNADFLPAFDYWGGWSYSNVVDTTTPGFFNQYASFPGGGSNGIGGVAPNEKYAILGGGGFFNLPSGSRLQSLDITSTTYVGRFVLNGDAFGLPFSAGDFLEATFTGYNAVGGASGTGTAIGNTIITLADFREGQTFLLSSWNTFGSQFDSLGQSRSFEITFLDSRNGASTPYYLALDNLNITAVPEPASMLLFSAASMFGAWRYRRRAKQVTMAI